MQPQYGMYEFEMGELNFLLKFLKTHKYLFYFEKINGKKILKSSVLDGLNHFFTTRESVIKTKEPDFEKVVEENKKDICSF